MAAVKWCIVTAAASEGESEPMARCTRIAVSGSAPCPPYSAGTSRPTPPQARKSVITGLPGCSRSGYGTSSRALTSPGWWRSQTVRAKSRERIGNLRSALAVRGCQVPKTARCGLMPPAMLTPCRCEVRSIG